MNFMSIATAGKDPGQFAAPPETLLPVAQQLDTPDTSPGADETH
jgi:hypothetical protein